MWILTRHGFFSAVCARQGDGSQGNPIDPDRIMIRARLRTHLEAHRKRFLELLGDGEIFEDTGTDYAFRIFVDKPAWSRALAELAMETDDDNFKSAVARHQRAAGAKYERALHQVWSVMHRLQDE